MMLDVEYKSKTGFIFHTQESYNLFESLPLHPFVIFMTCNAFGFFALCAHVWCSHGHKGPH